ncbi:MAG: hypothetical protein GX364_07750 [Firmicutes bacterium]|jgi:hypothetical protein|nr:hypothetical protein [Bacillota bacterium]
MTGRKKKIATIIGIMLALMALMLFFVLHDFTIRALARPSIEMGRTEGFVGAAVTAPVIVRNLHGVAGIVFTITFDPDALAPEEIRATDLLGKEEESVFDSNLEHGPGRLKFAWAGKNPLDIDEGVIVEIDFLLKKAGEFALELKVLELVDEKLEDIPAELIDSRILVRPLRYGDLSGNGEIDVQDAILLLKSVVKLIELTEDQKSAADVNGDDNINVADAILILRHIVKLIDRFPVELKQ